MNENRSLLSAPQSVCLGNGGALLIVREAHGRLNPEQRDGVIIAVLRTGIIGGGGRIASLPVIGGIIIFPQQFFKGAGADLPPDSAVFHIGTDEFEIVAEVRRIVGREDVSVRVEDGADRVIPKRGAEFREVSNRVHLDAEFFRVFPNQFAPVRHIQ